MRDKIMDWNQLYQGDCIESLGRIDRESVDLVFADPPFNIGYDYDVYKDRRGCEQYLAWTRTWGQAVHRVLKPSGAFWLAIGDDYAAELKLIFQNDLSFRCRSWVVWYYTFGVNCTKKFSRSHTHLFHFVKDPKKYLFNGFDIRVPSARQLVYGDSRADSRGRLPDDTWILRPQDLPEGFKPDEDTWYFRRVCGTFKERAGWHGCQMPEQLLGRIIRACSNAGDGILDPFAGSGTTLAVAKKLGRRWMGFEVSPNYATRARARLDATEVGQPLEGAEEPKVSAPPTPSRANKHSLSSSGAFPAIELREPEDFQRGIVAAFIAACNGFSSDRVIADPDLNGRFLQICRHFGLDGQPYDWNRRLMNLRKAGLLKELPAPKKTRLTEKEIDDYSYACEIAMREWKNREQTLDHVICDPDEAAKFDDYVRSMVSESVSSFKIRWVALHIRKRAFKISKAGKDLQDLEDLPTNCWSVASLDCRDLPESAGLYWLKNQANQRLYVGRTFDLRRRFALQFEGNRFDFWGTTLANLRFRYCKLVDAEKIRLEGNQSRWIRIWTPLGNYLKLAA
jgi:DNA modification methylase